MIKGFRYAVRMALMPVGYLLLGLIKAYQYLISPMFPPTCRFLPTCSQYAHDALRIHGPVRGLWLALWRLARCNPWGGHGYDPVPGANCENHGHTPGAPASEAPNNRRRPIEGTH